MSNGARNRSGEVRSGGAFNAPLARTYSALAGEFSFELRSREQSRQTKSCRTGPTA